MPEHVVLEGRLRGLDLEDLNARVRRGEVVLDWSAVEDPPDEAVSRLVEGLDLDRDAKALGIDSVPEGLADRLLRLIEAGSGRPPARPRASAKARGGARPATWRAPEDETPSEEADPSADEEAAPPAADTGPVLQRLSPAEVRDDCVRRILSELVGPAGGPEEVVTEATVRDRYIAGTLAPARQELPAEENDRLGDRVQPGDDAQEGSADDETAGRPALLPSSLGMTFGVAGDAGAVDVTVRYGRYERRRREELEGEDCGGAGGLVWKRVPVEGTLRMQLSEGELAPWSAEDDPEHADIEVRGRARRVDGHWAVTLFLVNGQAAPPKGSPGGHDSWWVFQAELEVAGPDGAAVFVRRDMADWERGHHDGPSLDERIVEMTYRNVHEFAVGHGVAVHWEVDGGDRTRARRITSRAVPSYEVPPARPPSPGDVPGLARAELDMKALAEAEPAGVPAKLEPLVEAYESWIADREEAKRRPEMRLAGWEEEADTALERCRDAARRMREGIGVLAKDPLAMDAFRFMNRAMWLQRVRSKLAEAVRRRRQATFEELDVPENRTWYPFQLAFVLLNVPACADLHHEDRRGGPRALADLLWFPTGGGKTEAYLGVSAFVMAARRLQGTVAGRKGDEGLAVLMRYTLRLLTLQQFQRAAALVCACEKIRREALAAGDGRLGEQPFRIGLWVGQRVTPNTTEQSHDASRRDRGDGWSAAGALAAGIGSPYQLLNCPWCGTEIQRGRDLVVELPKSGRGRTLVFCGDQLGDCPFSRRQAPGEGLPVMVVDEEMYRSPPALLIATVDKFAQMPWKGEVQTLFGVVAGRCERHGYRSPDLWDADRHPKRGDLPAAQTVPSPRLRPPDLVIQDELHLISGPLGTLVGLYETAVDALSTWEVDGREVHPKVIASTATVRRAPEQVFGVFERRVAVFPPPGLDVEDNFFSRQVEPSEKHPGRLYLGICTPGRRIKATLIRAFTAAMAAAQSLYEQVGATADPYMTAVGYFNSMRELGAMRRLVDDDVASRLRDMDRRGLARRLIDPRSVDELTSRKGAVDIPRILDRLEVPFDPETERERRRPQDRRRRDLPPRPLDVVLATNMISVGVDVSRLGLMVVGGQPKNTAEYIQATSRVGRASPGLVVTVYNWARPRDLSHYERFEHYHACFYKHVEALSVTPFAARAQDRGAVAVLAALVRLRELVFNGNAGAAEMTTDHPLVREAIDTVVHRAQSITGSEREAGAMRRRLRWLADEWRRQADLADPARPLGYRDTKETRGLLESPGREDWTDFTCLTSLRDVEPMVGLVLRDDGSLDHPPAWTAAAEKGS